MQWAQSQSSVVKAACISWGSAALKNSKKLSLFSSHNCFLLFMRRQRSRNLSLVLIFKGPDNVMLCAGPPGWTISWYRSQNDFSLRDQTPCIDCHTPRVIIPYISQYSFCLFIIPYTRRIKAWISLLCDPSSSHWQTTLTHYRPALPYGNRKFYFRGPFQFSIVTI